MTSVFEIHHYENATKRISLAGLAANLVVYKSAIKNGKPNVSTFEAEIKKMLELLPHGNGIDNGTKFDIEKSEPDRLIFTLDFHHTDDVGNYIKWTSHVITIIPSFRFGFIAEITGEDFNEIKEYLIDLMYEVFES